MCVCVCVQVVFVNEQTGEYQYYDIQFRAVRPGITATIKLSAPVRSRRPHTITLDNPLTTAVNFIVTCNSADIQLPSQMFVPAQSQVSINWPVVYDVNILWFPEVCTVQIPLGPSLQITSKVVRVERICRLLGYFRFDLDYVTQLSAVTLNHVDVFRQ